MKRIYNVLEIGGYSDFQCIGPNCEDDCCRGWNIVVDTNKYIKYKQIKDKKIKDKIVNSIDTKTKYNTLNRIGTLKLDNNKRCILQDEDKLCFIHKNLGEEYLCKTCREYPKVINSIDGTLEVSYMLSCPEVVRKILLTKEIKSFNFVEKLIDSDFIANKIELSEGYGYKSDLFWDIRSVTIHILQSRKYKLWQRILIAGFLYESLEKCINSNDKVGAVKAIEKYKSLVDSDEIMDINILVENDKKLEVISSLYNFIVDCMSISESDMSRLDFDKLDLSKAEINKVESAINDYEYIFENYLVNYIFQSLIPLGEESLIEQYYKMVFNYGFIISLLYGKSSVESITENIIVDAIYLLTRSIMHNIERVREIEAEFKRNNMYTLAYITMAVKF
ncbi:MAG: flagellin lysine-N-methylase [Clostridium sp.]